VRILIALEPHSYSEAIGGAIQELRPHLEVKTIERSDTLGSEVARPDPKVVLCSQRESTGVASELVWIEHRPYTEPKVTIYMGGVQHWKQDVSGLADLLSVVDRAESLVQAYLCPEAVDLER
jgi:hypothetical protein